MQGQRLLSLVPARETKLCYLTFSRSLSPELYSAIISLMGCQNFSFLLFLISSRFIHYFSSYGANVIVTRTDGRKDGRTS